MVHKVLSAVTDVAETRGGAFQLAAWGSVGSSPRRDRLALPALSLEAGLDLDIPSLFLVL